MFITAFLLFWALQGRGYYMAPAYPMLLAAGAVVSERRLDAAASERARVFRLARFYALVAAGAVLAIAVVVPIAPVGSRWWNAGNKVQDALARRDRLAGIGCGGGACARLAVGRRTRRGHDHGRQLRRGVRDRSLRRGVWSSESDFWDQFLLAAWLWAGRTAYLDYHRIIAPLS